jgi:hypothetical protein
MRQDVLLALSAESRLDLFPLRARRDGSQYVVGRPETGSYVATSDAGFRALQLLQAGWTVAEIKHALRGEPGGHDVRLGEFLNTLVAAGFVKSIDGREVVEGGRRRRYHLTGVERRHIAWLFSTPALALYAVLIAAATAVVILDPSYLPRPADFFVASTYVATVALSALVSAVMVAKHELAHLFAGKLLGLEARFGFSHRLFFPVVQTELTDLWLVAPRRRYVAYAAGMVSDVVVAAAVVLALWLHDRGVLALPDLVYRVGKLAVFIAAAGIVWQLNFFMRTDVYYMIATFFDCKNLAGDARTYLRSRFRPVPGVTRRELRVIRAYAAIYVAGTTACVILAAAYVVGVLYVLIAANQSEVWASRWPSGFRAIDKIAFVMTLALTGGWLAWSLLVGRRTRSRFRYRLASAEEI